MASIPKTPVSIDSDKALSDTRVKIDLIKNKLPEDTEEPVVTEVNLSRFPVLAIAISGKVEDRILNKRLNRVLKKFKNKYIKCKLLNKFILINKN